jgi:hypothetical protein
MYFSQINKKDVSFIAENLRMSDKNEVFATRWTENGDDLADAILSHGDFGWIACADDGTPVSAFGAVPLWNGVWSVWMFATDRWPEVSLSVTRFIKKIMTPALEEVGYHRAECKSLAENKTSHRWLELLGASKESEAVNFGRNGETFYTFSWIRPVTRTHLQACVHHLETAAPLKQEQMRPHANSGSERVPPQ